MSKRFPVEQIDVATRCAREGMPWGSSATYSATPAVGTVTLATTSALPAGQANFVQTLTFGASRACEVRIQVFMGGSTIYGNLGSPGSPEIAFYYPGSGVMNIPINQVFWGGATFSASVVNEGGSTPLAARIGVGGHRIADDQRWEAGKAMLMIGDSIQATGPSSNSYRDSLAIWQVRDYLLSQDKDYRLIMKQIGGTNSNHAELWRKYGLLDVPSCDLVCYQMGANDVSAAISQATYEANWLAMYNWMRLRYPGVKMIFLGPTPNENNTTEAGLATIRTNMSAWVTARADANVKYLNLGAAFDRTVVANYASSDTAGSRVHPSNAGNLAIYTSAWKPFIDANLSWF